MQVCEEMLKWLASSNRSSDGVECTSVSGMGVEVGVLLPSVRSGISGKRMATTHQLFVKATPTPRSDVARCRVRLLGRAEYLASEKYAGTYAPRSLLAE